MMIPNAERAVITAEKLGLYLLNLAHRRGGSKARLLQSIGYTATDWQHLETQRRAQHLTADVELPTVTDYGDRYDIVALITGPTGRSILFRSIWQVDLGADYPRLITMFPE